jgi:hypothetical protein
VELVPVDLHLQAADFKQKVDALFERVEEASERYCWLEHANHQHTERGGFAYLNSPSCALLQCEMQREMRATVDALGDPALIELYASWNRAMDLREQSMLDGVEAYSRQASFSKGLLLVGAAHRQPLFEKSELARNDGVSRVTWDFDWRLEAAPLADDAGDNTA